MLHHYLQGDLFPPLLSDVTLANTYNRPGQQTPVAAWSMSPRGDDEGPNKLTLTMSNVIATTGVVGRSALRFKGAQIDKALESRVSIERLNYFTSSISITGWVLADEAISTEGIILARRTNTYDDSSHNKSVRVALMTDGNGGELRMKTFIPACQNKWWGLGAVSTSTWFHFAITYESRNHVYHYIDGRLVGKLACDGESLSTLSGITSDENAYEIGFSSISNPSQIHLGKDVKPLSGALDDLKMFTEVLSGNDVEQIFNAAAPWAFSAQRTVKENFGNSVPMALNAGLSIMVVASNKKRAGENTKGSTDLVSYLFAPDSRRIGRVRVIFVQDTFDTHLGNASSQAQIFALCPGTAYVKVHVKTDPACFGATCQVNEVELTAGVELKSGFNRISLKIPVAVVQGTHPLTVTMGEYTALGNLTAVACAPGSIIRPIDTTGNSTAEKNRSSSSPPDDKCMLCPQGFSSQIGDDVCSGCAQGKFNDVEGGSCASCPVGRYGTLFFATSIDNCTTCKVGRYSGARGATSAAVCKACALTDDHITVETKPPSQIVVTASLPAMCNGEEVEKLSLRIYYDSSPVGDVLLGLANSTTANGVPQNTMNNASAAAVVQQTSHSDSKSYDNETYNNITAVINSTNNDNTPETASMAGGMAASMLEKTATKYFQTWAYFDAPVVEAGSSADTLRWEAKKTFTDMLGVGTVSYQIISSLSIKGHSMPLILAHNSTIINSPDPPTQTNYNASVLAGDSPWNLRLGWTPPTFYGSNTSVVRPKGFYRIMGFSKDIGANNSDDIQIAEVTHEIGRSRYVWSFEQPPASTLWDYFYIKSVFGGQVSAASTNIVDTPRMPGIQTLVSIEDTPAVQFTTQTASGLRFNEPPWTGTPFLFWRVLIRQLVECGTKAPFTRQFSASKHDLASRGRQHVMLPVTNLQPNTRYVFQIAPVTELASAAFSPTTPEMRTKEAIVIRNVSATWGDDSECGGLLSKVPCATILKSIESFPYEAYRFSLFEDVHRIMRPLQFSGQAQHLVGVGALNRVIVECRTRCIDAGPNSIFTPTKISGITFQSGRLDGGGDDAIYDEMLGGAGLLISDLSTDILIMDCMFRNFSSSAGPGGAIAVHRADSKVSVLFSRVVFQDNRALNSNGGALFSSGVLSVNIEGTSFQRNSAQNGGAVYLASGDGVSTLWMSNSTAEKNTAFDKGGAIFMDSTTLCHISQSNFTGSEASEGAVVYTQAGGLNVWGSHLDFSDSRKEGAIMCISSRIKLEKSSLRENRGSALSGLRCKLSIFESTFRANIGSLGGAVRLSSESSFFGSDSTFIGNSAVELGGAVACDECHNVLLSNSVVSKNIAAAGGGIALKGSRGVSLTGTNVFQDNSATDGGGGGIFTKDQSVLSDENVASISDNGGNSGLYGPLLGTAPNELRVVDATLAALHSIVAKNTDVLGVAVRILDKYGNPISGISLKSFFLVASVRSGALFGTAEVPVQKYQTTEFSDMGFAMSEGKYNITFALNIGSRIITTGLEVALLACEPGFSLEGAQETGIQCTECIPAFTTGGGNASCFACPEGHLKLSVKAAHSHGPVCGPCDARLLKRIAAEPALAFSGFSANVSNVGDGCNMCIGAFLVNEDQHQRGYYLEKDQTCNKCPAGANCSLSGVDLHGLQSLESFWRPNKDDNTFYPCPYDGDCAGSYIVNNTNDQCAPGHHGTLCAVCLPKHVRVAGRCKLCVGGDSSDGFLVIAGIIMLLFGLVLFKHMTKSARFTNALRRSRSRAAKRNKKSNRTMEEHLENQGSQASTTADGMSATVRLYSSFRILIGFIQINAALNLGFDIPWPNNFLDFIEISSIVNINFDKILAPLSPCALEMRFIPSMYSHMTTLPVILTEVAGVAGLVLYLRTRKTKWGRYLHAHVYPIDLLQRTTRVALFVVFLMLPGLGTRIFRTFHCVNVGENEWLSSDFKIRCWVDNEGHKLASIWAGVFMLFYVIGIPVGSVAILYRFRTRLNDPKIKAALGSLYISYKPQFWWFESVGKLFPVLRIFFCVPLLLAPCWNLTQKSFLLMHVFLQNFSCSHGPEDDTRRRLGSSRWWIFETGRYWHMRVNDTPMRVARIPAL
jgi:predicted outer membrane repeat protein